jgi:translation initiation factor 1
MKQRREPLASPSGKRSQRTEAARDTASSETLRHNPFGALVARGDLAPGPAPEAASDPQSTHEAPPKTEPAPLDARIVVRRESKGRGGKTVVRISGLPSSRLEELAGRMKKALGCGALVEDADLLLLGSVQERARDWLIGEGASRVQLGN